jgi:DNA integrity scanning protein DisA with diadenylate cyclase activity
MEYTSSQLSELSKNNPKELARILADYSTHNKILIDGVEILGSMVEEEDLVLPIFRRLLKHTHAMVRESAVIGVSSFYISKKPPEDIMSMVRQISTNDPFKILKEYAGGVLKDLEKL